MTTAPPKHPRGLPSVLFIEDEETFLKETNLTPEEAALEMRKAYEQLRNLRDSLAARKEMLESKVPEHDKALAMVRHLARAEEPVHTRFELVGGVYAKASVQPASNVALWLGANVMVEVREKKEEEKESRSRVSQFTLAEAEAFLTKQLEDAKGTLLVATEDLQHIDDQRNTLEVNVNRMHNFSVQRRKRLMAAKQQQGTTPAQLEAQLENAKIK